MSMTTTASSTPIVLAQRVITDPSLSELDAEIKNAKRGWVSWAFVLGIPVITAIMLGSFYLFGGRMKLWELGAILMMNVIVSGAFSALYMFHANRDFINKKEQQRTIKASHSVAQSLDPEVIPVLTKEHVKAFANLEAVLYRKARDNGKQWADSDEVKAIGALLFQDLNRENSILSLITERGVVTAAEIEERLLEMESGTARPIESGWL